MTSLYLTYDGLTDPLGQSQILPYILGLEEKGVSFYIISFEKKEAFKKNEAVIRNLILDRKIAWHPQPYHKKPPVISTIRDIFTLRKKANKIVYRDEISIVHCRSYITALVGLWLKKKFGLKFIFDMRGFWADERLEGKIWNTKNPVFKLIYNYFKTKEIDFFEKADAIISLTDSAKEEIHNILSINHPITQSPNNKVTTIPCCTDLELFNNARLLPSWKQEIRRTLAGEFSLRLIYIGSLGTWYMLKEMLGFFEAILNQRKTVQFIFLTKEVDIISSELQKRNWMPSKKEPLLFQKSVAIFSHLDFSGSKIIVTQSERSFVPYFLDYCDASILFIKPSFSKKASSATKMGEVLALNKPVITNTGWGDVDHFSTQTKSVLVVRNFNSNEYVRIAEELQLLIKSGKVDALRFAQEKLSLADGIQKYVDVYQSLSS